MSTELKAEYESAMPLAAAPAQSTALATLATLSEAERRVQLAKDRLQHHLSVFDHRARSFAKQSAWIAGMVLLGIVGAAAAASVFRPKPKRSRYYADSQGGSRGVGPALMLAAFGLLSRGARSFASQRMRT
jgi:hypothetical protein